MRTTNYSNEHARARVYGWNGGASATPPGTGAVLVELEDTSSPTNATTLRLAAFTDNGGGDVSALPQVVGPWVAGDGVFSTSGGRPRVLFPDDTTPTDGLDVSAASTQLFSQHTPGDLTDAGVVIEAGDDYVGIRLSEKDAATFQIYPDVSGGYTVEFVERTAGHFEFVVSGGAARAVPALGMLPIYAAAPFSGSEVEGMMYFDSTLHLPRFWNGSAWVNF